VNVAPIIRTERREIPAVLEAAKAAGADEAGTRCCACPTREGCFSEWLKANFPEKLERILGTIRDVRAAS